MGMATLVGVANGNTGKRSGRSTRRSAGRTGGKAGKTEKYERGTRSYTMSHIRGKDTTRSKCWSAAYLFRQGLRFRKNDKRYPGHPDIVLPKYHVTRLRERMLLAYARKLRRTDDAEIQRRILERGSPCVIVNAIAGNTGNCWRADGASSTCGNANWARRRVTNGWNGCTRRIVHSTEPHIDETNDSRSDVVCRAGGVITAVSTRPISIESACSNRIECS